MSATIRAILGFALAPLAPFPLLAAIVYVGDVDTSFRVDRDGGIILMVAYVWTPLIAVPAWRLVTKHGTFGFLHASAVGGLVGFMVWATLPALALPACIGLGLFAGLAFRLICPGGVRAT